MRARGALARPRGRRRARAEVYAARPSSLPPFLPRQDGVAFARDLGFASFGELVLFVPSPARLKALQREAVRALRVLRRRAPRARRGRLRSRVRARPRPLALPRVRSAAAATAASGGACALYSAGAPPAPFLSLPLFLDLFPQAAGAVSYVEGMIVGLERDLTSVVILGNERLVKVGDRILARKGIISVSVGVGVLGRVLNPLGASRAVAAARRLRPSPLSTAHSPLRVFRARRLAH